MVDPQVEMGIMLAFYKPELDSLFENLRQAGYQLIGPKVKDHTIIYAPIQSMKDLPKGFMSQQEAGVYRLYEGGHANYFNVTPGPHSWKQFFFPPVSHMFTLQRKTNGSKGWQTVEKTEDIPAYALVGVLPCDLAAIQIQDRVFLQDQFRDPVYRSRRQRAFILAINCLNPCDTCFCTSTNCGPEAEGGYDLCLTELEDVFLVKVGSEAGRMALGNITCQPASAFWLQAAREALEAARKRIVKRLPEIADLPSKLLNSLEHPRWDDVAKRCLSCTNCTQVCPTCFCWDVRDFSNLAGTETSRDRVWDSCFNPDYSYLFGGNSRPNTRSRYRQWLIHKLASWHQQFGTSGCVGCGRCITWCPARIDLTEEVAAICQEASV